MLTLADHVNSCKAGISVRSPDCKTSADDNAPVDTASTPPNSGNHSANGCTAAMQTTLPDIAENAEAELTAGGGEIRMLGVDQLRPCPWNPNEMSEAGFQQLVAETRHLGHAPQVILVRPLGDDKYEIVNGEHNWLASQEAGFKEVRCLSREMADFEAMRQTYKSNQHGHHNPLEEGEMFVRMMRDQDGKERLSLRALAEMICIDDKTIRNKLLYVRALKLRSSSAPTDDDRRIIGALKDRQVKMYLKLPAAFRDRWLDAGASLTMLDENITTIEGHLPTATELIQRIDDAGLLDLLQPGTDLLAGLTRLGRVAIWCWEHLDIDNVGFYARTVATLRMKTAVLDCLPCEVAADHIAHPVLTPEQWEGVLRRAKEQASDAAHQDALIQVGVQEALKAAGKDPLTFCTPKQVVMLAELGKSPDFIQNATFLTVEERVALAEADGSGSAELIRSAKEMTIEEFRQRRAENGDVNNKSGSRSTSHTIVGVFYDCLSKLRRQQDEEAEEESFFDTDSMRSEVLAYLREDRAVRHGRIDDRPASDVLAEQIFRIDGPIIHLLVAALRGNHRVLTPAARWLEAAGGKMPAITPDNNT